MTYPSVTVFILLAAVSIPVQAQVNSCLTSYDTCVSNFIGTKVTSSDLTVVVQDLTAIITNNIDKICKDPNGFAKCISDFGSCLGAGSVAGLDTLGQSIATTCASGQNNGSPSKTYGPLSFLPLALYMIF